MNMSFWSHCQGLIRRLQNRHRRDGLRRELRIPWHVAAEVLEYRCLLSAVPAPSGVVAWWSGDGTATDQVGLNDGILANGAGYAAANVGSGFNFDGIDDNFHASTVGFPTGSANRTIELWVRIDRQVSEEACFAAYGALGSYGQVFALGTSSGELFVSNWGNAIFGPALQNGQWYHVAATNVGNSFTLYLDGAEIATGTMPVDTPAGSTFWMGRMTDGVLGDNRRLDGMVDEVTVYNRALSASEIATIYNAGSEGKSKVPTPSLDVSGFPATITAGSAGSFTITAKNADGTTNTGYLGTVHFTSTDPQAVLPADYSFTAADNGVHTFTASLKTAGTQSITATDPQAPGMAGDGSTILVQPAAASTMTVGGFPSTTPAGLAGNITVTLKDPYGNIASGYTGTVRLTSTDPRAVLPANYTFTAVDAGQHTLSVTLKMAGTQSITVTDTTSAGLTGTEGGITVISTAVMVGDINPGPASADPGNLVAIGSTIYFTASDSTDGQELWKSDGTPAGTTLVKDISPGVTSSSPAELTNVNGTLFFTASDGIKGVELWKSDGTPAGTMMVKDLNLGAGSSSPGNFTNVNGTLYFSANDGINGRALWKSDGTAGGTVMLSDINPGSVPSYPGTVTNVNGTLYFSASDGINGFELWKSDGTPAGTAMLKDITLGGSSSYPDNLTNVNGTLYFSASDGVHVSKLWKSDGTAAGTVQVKDNVSDWEGYGPTNLTNVNGTLFFAAYGTEGNELWKSDGTSAGTTLVKDIYPGVSGGGGYVYPNGSYPANLTNVNGTLFFTAGDATGGNLWKSDGTDAGTVKVANTSIEVWNDALTNVNGTLFFTANDGINGYELWTSDGTAAETIMVKDIKLGGSSSSPSNLTNANGILFFTADDGIHGRELWALSTVPTPSLDVGGFPATITAGSAGSFTITAKNADATTNTSYVGTVHFTSSDPQAVLPADYTFTAADHGVHTFAATLRTAGSQAITATDPHLMGVGESIILVKAAASTMTVGGFPSTTTAGALGNVTVTLKDVYGNIASGYTGTVRITSSDAQAALPANYTFTAVDAGQHTFSVTLKTAGTRSITVADTLMSALTATQGGITVNAGAASQFLISAPSSVKAGVAFSLTLTVKDAYGNVVIGYTGTVRFTSTDNSAKLPANYTFTAADKGVHTFTGLILRKKGNNKMITITDTLYSSLTASVVENVT